MFISAMYAQNIFKPYRSGKSFPDTESAEYVIQNVFRVNGAVNQAELIDRIAEFQCNQ